VAARYFSSTFALTLLGVVVSQAARSQSGEACDRECLIGFADRFIKSLVAHEPGRGQLAKTVKYTENGQTLRPGDGFWASVTEDSTYRIYAADPAAGQVVWLGVMKEGGTPVIVAVRLRVEAREITQAEAVIARNEPAIPFRPELLASPHPLFTEAAPSTDRPSREKMLGIVNTYLDGFDENDSGKGIPFDKECQRIENGLETAGATDPSAEPMRKLGCQEQLNTGHSKLITEVRERRFLVVDDERGLVFAIEFFDYAGLLKTVRLADGTTLAAPAAMQKPCSLMIANLLKIKEGRIRQIEAVVVPVPYGMRSGWARR